MSDDATLVALVQAVGKLEGMVETGFDGIHKRQDITNGRIAKIELKEAEDVSRLEERIDDLSDRFQSFAAVSDSRRDTTSHMWHVIWKVTYGVGLTVAIMANIVGILVLR